MQTGEPIAGAEVTITQMPPRLEDRVKFRATLEEARWEALDERVDRTRTASEGSFCFVDLPEGQYTLTVVRQAPDRRYATGKVLVKVSVDDEGTFALTAADIALNRAK